jgi:hypothetical protein
MPPFSILDLAPVPEGGTPADALHNSLWLAQKAEALGYRRFWLAEHHGMAGIASAATSVVIGFVAGGTRTIRVGSGGIMLRIGSISAWDGHRVPTSSPRVRCAAT